MSQRECWLPRWFDVRGSKAQSEISIRDDESVDSEHAQRSKGDDIFLVVAQSFVRGWK